jgi:hypothetical protein
MLAIKKIKHFREGIKPIRSGRADKRPKKSVNKATRVTFLAGARILWSRMSVKGKASDAFACWLADLEDQFTLTKVSATLRSFFKHTGKKSHQEHHIPGRL